MKEQLISFETAKLSWEKGFRIVTKLNPNYYERYNINKVLGRPYGYTIVQDFLKEKDPSLYLAPTQALLQKWLRKIHFIDAVVEPDFDKNFYDWYIYDQNESKKVKEAGETYIIYEEALEEALQEALKLI